MLESDTSHNESKIQKYIPAHEAGQLFGYTSNYVRRLLRERKIIGAQVDRQWFVDMESLGAFVLNVSKQKAIQSEAIREARKIERACKRILSGNEMPLVERAMLVPDSVARIRTVAPRMRALLSALGMVAAGAVLGMLIHTTSLDEARRFAVSTMYSAQEITLGDMYDTLEDLVHDAYTLTGKTARVASGLAHAQVAQAARGIWSTLWCDTRDIFGFPCAEDTPTDGGDVLATVPPLPPSAEPIPVAESADTGRPITASAPLAVTKIIEVSKYITQTAPLPPADYVTMRDLATGLLILRGETDEAFDEFTKKQIERRALRSTNETADNIFTSIEDTSRTKLSLSGGTLTGGLVGTNAVFETLTATSATTTTLAVTGTLTTTATTTSPYFAASTLGTVGAPAFTFSNDLNIGLWSSGADTLNLSTAGSERLRIDASGNLGIGTTTPGTILSVQGIANFAGTGSTLYSTLSLPSFSGTSTTATSTLATGGFTVGTNHFLVQQTSGRIGIGTTSPYEILSVVGNGTLTGNLRLEGTTGLTLAGNDADITFIGTGNHDITASVGTLRLGANTIIGNILALDNTIDIGTAGTRFDKIYADEINATTLVGTLTGGNLTAETFSINSDNATADTEDANLAFERGTLTPNALMTWDSTNDEFDFNSSLHFTGTIASANGITLDGFTTDITTGTNQHLVLAPGGTGFVGISTTSPYGLFSIEQGTETASLWVGNTGSTTPSLVVNGVNGNGNVGIGTVSPDQRLDVIGRYRLIDNETDATNKLAHILSGQYTNANGDYTVLLGIGTSADNEVAIGGGTAAGDAATLISFYTASAVNTLTGTERVRITNDGNVGIGTTSPVMPLDVESTTFNQGMVVYNRSATAGQSVPLWLTSTNGVGTISNVSIESISKTAAVASDMVFRTGALSVVGFGTERMRIDNTGNVGIGTTTPAEPLTVFKSGSQAYRQLSLGSTAGRSLLMGIGTVDAIIETDTTNNADLYFQYSSTGSVNVGTSAYSDTAKFTVAGTANISGNVGIGTTSPGTLLSLQGGTSFLNFGIASGVGSNMTFGTPASNSTIQHDTAVSDDLFITNNRIGGGSDIIFRTSTGGTTDRMVIQGAGNVGIGTSTPSAILEVSAVFGTFKVTGTVSAPHIGSQFLISANQDGLGRTIIGTAGQGRSMYFENNGDITIPTALFTFANATGTQLTTTGSTYLATTGGNVGIGTTGPGTKLHVAGDAPIIRLEGNGADAGERTWQISNAVQSYGSFGFQQSTTKGGTTFSTKLMIDENGNVGIGTTSPGALLHLSASTPELRMTHNNTANYSFMSFYENATARGYIQLMGSTFTTADRRNDLELYSSSGDISFWPGEAQQVTFKSGGNVGIGTTGPRASLHATYPYASTDTTERYPFILSANDDTNQLYFGATGSASQANRVWKIQTSANGVGDAGILALQSGGGNVGIGTTGPSQVLDVVGDMELNGVLQTNFGSESAPTHTFITDTNTGMYRAGADQLGLITGGTERVRITDSGNVGIGTTSPATKLEVGGATANVTFDGYLNCTGFTSNANGLLACTASDERLKQDITALDSQSGLAAINALNPVSFYWKSTTERGAKQQYGLIAQEVAEVFPNLVQKTNPTLLTPGGTLSVNYEGLFAPIILAIQELAQNVTDMALQLNDLAATILGFQEEFTTKQLHFESASGTQLCLGETCVTEVELKQLLDESGKSVATPSSSADSGSSTTTEAEPVVETTEASGTISATTSEPTAETAPEPSTPVTESAPAAEPAPAEAPASESTIVDESQETVP